MAKIIDCQSSWGNNGYLLGCGAFGCAVEASSPVGQGTAFRQGLNGNLRVGGLIRKTGVHCGRLVAQSDKDAPPSHLVLDDLTSLVSSSHPSCPTIHTVCLLSSV